MKRIKELIILIPLAIAVLVFVVSFLVQVPQEQLLPIESSCQQGWYKYDVKGGILCSKIELTDEYLKKYEP